jgi:exonuclease III
MELISHNTEPLKILQFNCNSLTRKIDEIIFYMNSNNINIAAIQETRLSAKSNLYRRGNYTIIRADRDKNSGGG